MQFRSLLNGWSKVYVPSLGCAIVFILIILGFQPSVGAVAQMVQVQTASANSSTVSATLSPAAKPKHLLIIVCASRNATTFTTPTGFTLAKSDFATAPSQAIYYKVAVGGETSFSCAGGSTSRRGIQLYEYSGTATTTPLETVNAGTSTGTSTSAASGTVTTTSANTLLLAAVVARSSGTGISAWSNSFVERADFTNTARFGGADRYPITAGSYSTVATMSVSSTWVGQIAAYKLLPIELSADIVDASNVSVSSPSVAFPAKTFDFSCQSSVGTLGVTAQQLRVVNTTSNALWSLKVAATNPTDTWKDSGGTNLYDFNDPSGSGCTDGADTDSVGGQLSVDPSAATVTADSSCSSTGVTKGTAAAFSEGATDSITLLSGTATAELNCMWNTTGITMTQKIPAEAHNTSYSLGLTITLTAN